MATKSVALTEDVVSISSNQFMTHTKILKNTEFLGTANP